MLRGRQERGRSRLVFLGVVVEPSQLERLDALATRDRRSRSFLVREALDRWLAFADAHTAAQAGRRTL